MNRREFLTRSAAVFSAGSLASCLPARARAQEAELKITPLTIPLPIERELTALHISDTHLCYANDRDSDFLRDLSGERLEAFGGKSLEMLWASLRYAEQRVELLLHTGDMIDFVTAGNLDLTREAFAERDCFVSAGNHEFCQWVGDGGREDEEYKMVSFDRVQGFFPNDLRFCARQVGGINFVAFDDVYYYVADDLIDRFRAEAAKGLPIVAMCHCPLYTPELFEYAVSKISEKVAYVVGAPDEEMTAAGYPAHRFRQQRTNATTQAFLDYLKEEKALKAILCGHLHFPWQGRFSETAEQYVAGGNFYGAANEIKFVPEA
ncbi:MAG: metallophosphoesterase [Thermoguttaceae bacterium]|nr:metallophosphoesterase [Thermoguttaceae bacterium]